MLVHTVESHDVEERMQAFAAVVDKELTSFTPAQPTGWRMRCAIPTWPLAVSALSRGGGAAAGGRPRQESRRAQHE